MKKFILSLSLFIGLLLFTGCPFSADITIDQPAVRVNEKLIGTWELRSNTDASYVVTKFDTFTYKFEKQSKSNKDISTYFAFISDVAGTKYLNLWEETTSDKKTYYFYKFDMTNDAMVKFIPVTENIDEKFSTSAELKSFIAKNQNHSFFFEKDEDTYIKIK